MMLSVRDFFSSRTPLLMLMGVSLALPVFAGGRNSLAAETKATETKTADIKPTVEENDETGFEQTIEYNFSPEDRARLRKALADYSRNTDPEHIQIAQKRKAMRDSVEARFNECNKDNDDSLDRIEATACLPQIARHFSYVDVDEDNVITLEELELAQAKLDERQKAEEAKMEAKRILEAEAEIKNKGKVKANKQALNTRKHPS